MLKTFKRLISDLKFRGSGRYWERRYRAGRTSGKGSQGVLAEFKARVLNAFVAENNVQTVIEFGCGDGNQLRLAQYPRYLGLDVAKTAVQKCVEHFRDDPDKGFLWSDPTICRNIGSVMKADLTLSLDVVYHLVEDAVFERYMDDLFACSRRFVIVYSSNRNEEGRGDATHVRHRRFTDYVEQRWPSFRLIRHIENEHPEKTFADFYIFEAISDAPSS